MRFLNIAQRLYLEPWGIVPQMHEKLCEIFQAHLDKSAHDLEGISANFGPSEKESNSEMMGSGIAVIPIQGVISHRVSDIVKSSGVTDVLDIAADITKAVEEESVRGIILDIDSPGGSITGVPETAKLIREAAETKPIGAYTDSQIASAAFWLASGADAIVATQSASIGSIGLFVALLDRSKAFEKEGLKQELITSGEFKAIGLPGLPLSEKQRDFLQEGVDEAFAWFVAAINVKRDIPKSIMDGRDFFAEKALEFDLIDRVGDSADALSELEGLIGESNG